MLELSQTWECAFEFKLVKALETMEILILHTWILHWLKVLATAGMKIYFQLTHFQPMFSSYKSIWKPEVFRSFESVDLK